MRGAPPGESTTGLAGSRPSGVSGRVPSTAGVQEHHTHHWGRQGLLLRFQVSDSFWGTVVLSRLSAQSMRALRSAATWAGSS